MSSTFIVSRPGATLAALLLWLACQQASAQHTTDHSTDRVSADRSSNSLAVRDLRPPLRLERTVFFDGPRNAKTLLVFDDFLLVSAIPDSLQFSLRDKESGEVLWTESLGQADENASPVASYAEGKVLLGGADGFRLLNVETGQEVWRDESVGISSGRSPVLTAGMAVYAGSERIRRVDPTTRALVWERETGTVEAPLARLADSLYALEANGSLVRLDASSGELIWQVDNAGSDSSDVIATETQVFVSDFASNSVSAYAARDGDLLWRKTEPSLARKISIVLGSGQLFVLIPSEGKGSKPDSLIRSYDPRTGTLLWEARDQFIGAIFEGFEPDIDDGIAANGFLYYRSITTGRTIALDAFTGSIVWTLKEGFPVNGLAIANDALFILGEDFVSEGGTSVVEKSRVSIFRHLHTLFFPQMADGGGQTTRISLTNAFDRPVNGTVRFIAPDGEPMLVGLKNVEGEVGEVDFTIKPGAGLEIQTLGGETLRTGQVRVDSDGPLDGVSIFGFQDDTNSVFEAGIEAARPTNRAVVNVSKHGRLSTALAIAAPSDNEGASLQFFLVSRDGELLAERDLLLFDGAQFAQFVKELFPEVVGTEFEGTLRIEADGVFVATAIRTVDGVQLSSFPVNQSRR